MVDCHGGRSTLSPVADRYRRAPHCLRMEIAPQQPDVAIEHQTPMIEITNIEDH
jgi:hypothetical protein